MTEVWSELDPTLKWLWILALLSSIVFLFQAVLTFVGADASDGLNADFDGDLVGGDVQFQLFSFRNLINFLLGYSWTAISFYNLISNPLWLNITAFLVGVSFVLVFYVIIRQIQKLAEDNTFKISQALGQSAEVYLTIPANKTGKGKVQISVNGSIHELDAVTEHEKIHSGAMVKVVSLERNKLLVVEPL